MIKDVYRTPFVICGISKPLNDDSIYYKVRYKTYSGTEKEFWACQSTLLSLKELKTLFLSKGINCPENNILIETIEYISRSISEFGSCFKKEFSAKRNGWNAEGALKILQKLNNAAKAGNCQVCMFILERRFSEDFGRHVYRKKNVVAENLNVNVDIAINDSDGIRAQILEKFDLGQES